MVADHLVNPITGSFEHFLFTAVTDTKDRMDKSVVRMAVGYVIAGPRLAPDANTAARKDTDFNPHVAKLREQNIGPKFVFDIGRIFDDHMRHRFLLRALRPVSPPLLCEMMP